MKKRFFIITLILSLSIALLFSCKVGDSGSSDASDSGSSGGNTDGGLDSAGTADGIIAYTVVYEVNNLAYSIADDIKDSLPNKSDTKLLAATEEETEYEIVVGRTERDISARAYRRLERIIPESPSESRFVIYSDGKSVALAYDVDGYGTEAAARYALDLFVARYVIGKESVSLSSGTLGSGTVDIIDYQRTLDEVGLESKWSRLSLAIPEEYSEEMTEALRVLYSIYSSDVVSWFANLYEPSICICDGECQGTLSCGGGGYYYSNSARDTNGFLPDIESTRQALNFISGSGLAKSMGKSSYVDFIPDEMKENIVTFIKRLQAENGYFYHPQWGQELTDTQISRRARDLNWATKTLGDLGALPKYDTPNGMKGEGALGSDEPEAVSSGLTARLGSSAVTAVSRAILAAQDSYVTPHLRNEESFRAYLDSLPVETESYEVGNELAAQASQILARDADLKANGARYSLADIAIEWLNSKQNPKTGTWDEKYDYHATNGLMKISCFYNDMGAPLPYAAEAVSSALYSMTTSEDPYNVCCIYNNWFTINNVIENISLHGGASANEKIDEIRALLYAQGAESIVASAQKLLLFRKLDGSFSYHQAYSSYTSQGMPVCVPYSNEGDVNATDICIEGTLNNLFSALGLAHVKIPVLGKADAINYLMILEDIQPVIKNDGTVNVDYMTFDDDTVGSLPFGVSAEVKSSLASVTAEPDPRGDGNVLRFNSPADSGKQNSISISTSTASQSCYVFESDVCIESADDGYIIQLNMGRCYMLAFRISDGKLNLWDSSNTSSTARIETELGMAPAIGEWFNLKIEYYVGDDNTVRIIAYFNGRATAVSNNYYDNAASRVETGVGKPSASYTGITMSSISSRSSVVLLDNVALYKSSASYSMPTGKLYQNVDEINNIDKVYGFEESGAEYPDGMTVTGSGAALTDTDGGRALALTSGGGLSIPIIRRKVNAKCNLYGFDLTVDPECPAGGYLDVVLKEKNSLGNAVTAFRIETVGDYAVIKAAPGGSVTESYESTKIALGETVHVSFEYFEREHITLIYLDGTLYAASKELSPYGKQYLPGILEISAGGSQPSFTLDNIKAERNSRLFADALKPTGDEVIHGFEGADPNVILSGGAALGRLDGSNAATLPSGSGLTVPVEVRGVVTNSVLLSLDLATLSAGNEGLWYIAVTDGTGAPIFAIGVKREAKKLCLSEYSLSGLLSPVFYSAEATKKLNLEIKLYPEEDEAQIFVNGKCVGTSAVFYSESARTLSPEKIAVATVSGNSTLAVDNIRGELVYSVYEKQSEIYQSYEDNSRELTFDEAMTSRLPSKIQPLNATSAKTRIKEFMIYSGRSKALTFGTLAGGNDQLHIAVTETRSGYDNVVFSSDIYTDFISCTSGKPQYHIFFETASGTAYQLRIVLEDGTLTFRDHDNTSQGTNVKTSIAPNTWFNLRVEIELGDADSFKARCFVNGAKLFESDRYYGKGAGAAPYSSVERVRFYTMSAMTADISFDNVTFSQCITESEPPKDEEDGNTEAAEILPVKGGASGIVVLIHDDGDPVSAALLDSVYRKYSLRGNVALIADRVYDIEAGTAIASAVSSWKNLLNTGRWQITSHSKTHDFWGTDDSDGKITDEVVGSAEILRTLFAEQRVLTFAYPGFSAYEGTYSLDELYGMARELVSEHYISGRYFGSGGAFEMNGVEWDFVIAESIGQSYLNQTLATVDSAAEGKMAVIFMHQVCQDTANVPSQTVTYSHMSAIAERISGYVDDGLVWNAFYEDAVLYLREAESATVSSVTEGEQIKVTLTDSLPDEIYNYPLTVRLTVPDTLEAVRVTQGDRVTYAVCKSLDGRRCADVDIIPDGGVATVTAAALSDLPSDGEDSDSGEATDTVDFESSGTGSSSAISGDASISVSGSTVAGFDKAVTDDPTGADNATFGVTANSPSSNSHIYIDRASAESDTGNYYIFRTRLYLDAYLNGSMLGASQSFATLDFRIKGTSNIFYTVNLRRIRTNKNTPEESRGLALTTTSNLNTYLNSSDIIAYGFWVELTVELFIDSEAGTATAKFYSGDTLIATDTQAIKAEYLSLTPDRVDIKYLSGNSSVTYLDDVSFVRRDAPFINGEESDGSEDGSGTGAGGEESGFDGFDFESSSIGESSVASGDGKVSVSPSTTSDPQFTAGVAESPSGDGNKVLAVTNASGTNRHVRFDFDTSKGNASGNTYTVKMKLYISSEGAVDGANFADMDFRTTGGAILYTARMFWAIDAEGKVTVSLYSNVKTDNYGMFISGIATDEWIDFELVCYCYENGSGEKAVDSTVSVNGTVLGGHTGLTISGASTPITVDIDRFNIKTIKNSQSSFYIDNLQFTRTATEE
ncbi:MAG: hypothetical protein IJ488_03140 [Clostridia bacterium]|nr:hypothetical protein [Clostridia bacterium]